VGGKIRMVSLKKFLVYPLGFLAALIISSIVLLLINVDPLVAFGAILQGSLGTPYNISEVFVRTIPLLITALAFALPYSSGFWNIGGEGQLYIGALASVVLALNMGEIPGLISIPLIMLAAFVAGMAWIALPVFAKIKLGINEIFVTVALNFIAILFINFLVTGPIKEPGNVNPQTPVIPASTWLLRFFPPARIHIGIILPFVLAILFYLIIYKTSLGYQIRVSGSSIRAANYAGIKTSRLFLITGLVGGGLAGLAGMEEILGAHHLLIAGISPGFAFTGILVAVMGRFHPLGIIPAAIFFAALMVGGETMQRGANVPYGMISVIVALIALLVFAFQRMGQKE